MDQTLSAHDVRRIAVESFTDPRTVQRYMRGAPVRATVKARLDAALGRLGMSLPAPVAPPAGEVTP